MGPLQPLMRGPAGPLSWHSRAVKTKQTDFAYVKNYAQIQTSLQLHCSVCNCLELGLGSERSPGDQQRGEGAGQGTDSPTPWPSAGAPGVSGPHAAPGAGEQLRLPPHMAGPPLGSGHCSSTPRLRHKHQESTRAERAWSPREGTGNTAAPQAGGAPAAAKLLLTAPDPPWLPPTLCTLQTISCISSSSAHSLQRRATPRGAVRAQALPEVGEEGLLRKADGLFLLPGPGREQRARDTGTSSQTLRRGSSTARRPSWCSRPPARPGCEQQCRAGPAGDGRWRQRWALVLSPRNSVYIYI